MLSCRETSVSFDNQDYLVKCSSCILYVRGFILQLKMALASVVDFCVAQKEILEIGEAEERSFPCTSYIPSPSPSPKKATLKSQDFRISGVDSSEFLYFDA